MIVNSVDNILDGNMISCQSGREYKAIVQQQTLMVLLIRLVQEVSRLMIYLLRLQMNMALILIC